MSTRATGIYESFRYPEPVGGEVDSTGVMVSAGVGVMVDGDTVSVIIGFESVAVDSLGGDTVVSAGEALGATSEVGMAVAGTGVSVAAEGVSVGGIDVSVAPGGVSVGETGVSVTGSAVAVGAGAVSEG